MHIYIYIMYNNIIIAEWRSPCVQWVAFRVKIQVKKVDVVVINSVSSQNFVQKRKKDSITNIIKTETAKSENIKKDRQIGGWLAMNKYEGKKTFTEACLIITIKLSLKYLEL